MAGRAKRFFENGYNIPKYMINAKGKTLFEYSLSSLPLDLATKIIFVALAEHEYKYRLTDFIADKIKIMGIRSAIEIVLLEEVTRGQAETVLKAEKFIEPEQDLIIYNIDTYFSSPGLRQKILDKSLKKDGIISAFYLDNPDDKWSYASVDKEGIVTKTTEKIPISNYPLTGMYHFSKSDDFVEVAKNYIENNRRDKNEFYIAPMYNDLISNGKQFVIDVTEEFIPLGTPEDLKEFINA